MSEYIVQAADWAIDKNGNSLYQGCEEIVRCRDCEVRCIARWCALSRRFVEDEGFCAWGKRKESGE